MTFRRFSPAHPPTGFTLVELLVYMGLLAIFVTMISEIFLSILESKVENIAVASLDQDSKYLVNRLSYDIARASSITTPGSLGSSGSSLVMNVDGVTYTYSLSGTTVQITTPAGTQRLTSPQTEVTGLSFQRLGNVGGKDTIKLQATLQSVAQRRSGKETRTLTTTFGRRQ